MKELLITLIEELDRPNETSMAVWAKYWEARAALRIIGLQAYKHVTSKYIQEGQSLDFPSEGFKEIAEDRNENTDNFFIENIFEEN